MESGTVTRRVAAIVIADVVGYTRLMECDDTGTFARLGSIRSEVIDPAIISHGGHIVQTAGDGWLAEFPSALAALRASIQIQRDIAKRNAGAPQDERIEYRMGVNLGDIMVQGAEIAGDGVNVASRLESLAEPGGICISTAVREQIHGQLDAAFIDAGEQHVKNITRPIRVYRVVLASPAPAQAAVTTTSTPQTLPKFRWRSGALSPAGWRALVVSVVVLALAFLTAWYALRPSRSIQTAEKGPPALSVAILPFMAPSGDVDLTADGLSQGVASELGRDRWMKIASWSAVAAYKGKVGNVPAISQDLNVRYLVQGELRQTSETVVVAYRLVDGASGAQLMTNSTDIATAQFPAEHDMLYGRLARRISNALFAAEKRRAVADPRLVSKMDLVLRGDGAWDAMDNDFVGAVAARKFYSDALRIDPDFVPALVRLAETQSTELEEAPSPDREQVRADMDRVSGHAIRIDRMDALAWRLRSESLQWQGRWEEAVSANEREEILNPNSRGWMLSRSWIMIQTGRPAEALPLAERALAFDPEDAGAPLHFVCKCRLFLGQYGDAASTCEKAAALNNHWLQQVYLAAAYAQNGDSAKATLAGKDLLKLQPGFSIARYRAMYAKSPPAFFDLVDNHLAPGLRKAGIPEK